MLTLRTSSSATDMPFVRAYGEVGYERALSTMVANRIDPIFTPDLADVSESSLSIICFQFP